MAETNPNQPVGNWHYEWREVSNPYADFNQTKLYDVLTDFFSQLGHTHQKSDINNFSHTHQQSDITDLDLTHSWQLVTPFITNGSGGVADLYANEDIHMAELRWTYTNTVARASGDEQVYKDNNGYNKLIPSQYRPNSFVTGISHSGTATIRVASNGAITIRFLQAYNNTSRDFHFSLMWHY